MSKSETPTNEPQEKKVSLTNFWPAVLKQTSSEGYLIEYRYLDPISRKMVRVRKYVNQLISAFPKKRDGIKHAMKIANDITEKLMNGWMPAFESSDKKLYTPILKLRDLYLEDKKRDVREVTLTNYRSITKMFGEWIEATNRTHKVSGNFKREDAVYYMDYIISKGLSNRNYNNTLKGMKAMFSWAVEHCYCVENPFISLKTKKKENKKRILVDAESRKKIKEYLEKENPQFLLVCLLVYHSAMRPKEIANIRISDINIAGRYITVTDDNAKNGKARCATITKDIIEMLAKFASKKGSLYLFGQNKELLPDTKRCALSKFGKLWSEMRKSCKLDQRMQLYSLRDTGMIDLLHAGVNELSVQHHYDHSSLSIQAIYTNHFDPGLNETIYKNSPEF